MNIKSILGQLRSTSADARESALYHIFRASAGASPPPELREPIVELFGRGPPWSPNLLLVVCGCPTAEFEPALRDVIERGSSAEKARALEYLPLWRNHGELLARVRPAVESLSCSELPWPAFLASIRRVQIFGDGEEAWQAAANAVLRADQAEPWASIRPQAEELLAPAECIRINEHLSRMGGKQLRSDIHSARIQQSRRKTPGSAGD